MIAPHLEKRRDKRKKYRAFITIEDMHIGGIELAKMINYGADGLYFESDRIFEPGAEITISIENSPYAYPVKSESYFSKILWRKSIKNSIYSYGYGVKYVIDKIEKKSSETDFNETKDFRKHPRKHFVKQAFFTSQKRYYEGIIKNVSRGGCFIETSESFNLNQMISLAVPKTKIFKNIILKAHVVRISQIGIGVKFRSIVRKKS